MNTPILSVTDLSVRFGNLQAVNQVTFDAQQGISLTVGAGEVVGLFGRNGVGKTTVTKTIAGWVPPSSSELRSGSGLDRPAFRTNLLPGHRLRARGPTHFSRLGGGRKPRARLHAGTRPQPC